MGEKLRPGWLDKQGRFHEGDGPTPVDEAHAVFELRAERLRSIGYDEGDAMLIALSDRDIHDLEDQVADLIRRGCDPKTAREIAR